MKTGFYLIKTAGYSKPVQPLESKKCYELSEEERELLEQKYC